MLSSERLSDLYLQGSLATNQMASSKNQKASSKNQTVTFEEVEWFLRRYWVVRIHRIWERVQELHLQFCCSSVCLAKLHLGHLELWFWQRCGTVAKMAHSIAYSSQVGRGIDEVLPSLKSITIASNYPYPCGSYVGHIQRKYSMSILHTCTHH